jgi:hypothetical protein
MCPDVIEVRAKTGLGVHLYVFTGGPLQYCLINTMKQIGECHRSRSTYAFSVSILLHFLRYSRY